MSTISTSIGEENQQSSPTIKKDGTTETNNMKINMAETYTFPLDYFKDKKKYMKDIETKLNNEIGYRFWKRYINAAFWSYISMPINLSITLMTALSTGQATTNNLLPKELYVNISLATLVMSVLNTYFRPYIQMTKNMELMNKWNDIGCEFESVFYSESKYLEHVEKRLLRYEKLMTKVNDLKKTETMDTHNFLTDSIYFGIRTVSWGLKDRDSWLSLDESYKSLKKTNNSTQTTSPAPTALTNANTLAIEDSTSTDIGDISSTTSSTEDALIKSTNQIINPTGREDLSSLIKKTVANVYSGAATAAPTTSKLAKYRAIYKDIESGQ